MPGEISQQPWSPKVLPHPSWPTSQNTQTEGSQARCHITPLPNGTLWHIPTSSFRPNRCRASKDTRRALKLQLPGAAFPAAQHHHSAFKIRLLFLLGVFMALGIAHLVEAVLDHTQPSLTESGMYIQSQDGWMCYSQGWGMGHSSPTPLLGATLRQKTPLF